MAAEPSKWNVAPGANADCNDIPDVVDANSGLASLSAFFPQLTALPLSAGGKAPKREDFNGIFKKIAQWVYFYMQGGVPSWAKAVTYTAGSLASYGGKTWTALRNSAGVKPAEGAYWHALSNFYTSNSLVNDLLNRVYPVGSIYMSAVNVSPASFLGGTWQAIEQGRMLMAAGSSWQAGTTGGAVYHTLTVAEMPAHYHSATETAAGGHTHGASIAAAGDHTHAGTANAAGQHAHNASTGSAGTHAHSGSALEDGAHVHNASTGSAGKHAHTGTADTAGAHTHGASTGSAGAHSHSGSTNDAGSHYHTGTTNGNGDHSHTRGSMNITGTVNVIGYDAKFVATGAFYNTNSLGKATVQNQGDPDYVAGFDASRSWTGSTSIEGRHAHGFKTSRDGEHAHSLSIASAGAHTHTVTVASSGGHYHSLTISKAGDHAHSVTIASNGKHTHNLSIASAGAHTHSVAIAAAGAHTHNLSITAAGAHAHSVAIAAAGAHVHAITIGKTGSGAAFSILPPYIAVYMWRRTA